MATMEIDVSQYISEEDIKESIQWRIRENADDFIREWLTKNGEAIVANFVEEQAFNNLVKDFIDSHKTEISKRALAALDEIFENEILFKYAVERCEAYKNNITEALESEEAKEKCRDSVLKAIDTDSYTIRGLLRESECFSSIVESVVAIRKDTIKEMVNEMISEPQNEKYYFADKLGCKVADEVGDLIGNILKNWKGEK